STCIGPRCNYAQRVWNVATGKQTLAYGQHDRTVIAAALSPDGRLAATASVEIRLWDLTTGDTRKVLSGTGATAWAVGFARDSQTSAWGTAWRPGTASGAVPLLTPLQFDLRLPFVNQPLGQPEPLREATGRDFVRGQVTAGSYLLASRRGGPYGYNALLDVIK